MLIGARQLPTQLKQSLASLYAVYGDEVLLVQEAADAIRAAARAAGHLERTVFTVCGAQTDWSAIEAAGAALSLFADKRLLEVRIPYGKPGKDGSEALQRLAKAADAATDTITLVLLPRLDGISLKSPWFVALQTHGVVVRVDAVERTQLPAWIDQRLRLQGQHVAAGEEGQRTLAFMVDRVEGHLLAAQQEIVKLGLLYGPGELSFEQVRTAVLDVARFDPFRVPEAVLDGAVVHVQRMLEGLRAEGVPPVLVHWALADEVRTLHRACQALERGQPLPMVLRAQRIWGAREKRYERVLPRLRAAQTGRWLDQAHTVDGIVKGLTAPGWPADPWQALQRLAFEVAAACAAAA